MWRRKLTNLNLLWIIFLLLLLALSDSKASNIGRIEDGQFIRVEGKIYKKERKTNTQVLYLKNLRIVTKDTYEAADVRLPVYLARESARSIPEIGKYVQISGSVKTIQKAPNPGNFNQQSYYQKQQIYWMVQEGKLEKVGGKPSILSNALWEMNQKLCARVMKHMDERTGGVLCAMLFGNTSYMNGEVKEYYQKTGIGHLYAVSSLHMNFWGMGLYNVLLKFGCKKKKAVLGGCLFLSFYVLFSGMSVSAVRSFLMYLIRMGAIMSGKEYDGITAISVSAVIQLTMNPFLFTDAGFLLSYGAVSGIYLLGPVLQDKVAARFATPLAVNAMLLPIMFYFYYEICTYSFLWNLVTVPLSSVIMSFGMLGIMFTPILYVPRGILLFFEWGSRYVLTLPAAKIVVGQPQMWQIVFYYLLLFLAFLGIKNRKWLYSVGSLILAVFLLGIPHQVHRTLEITMLNVGQGDCFFLQLPGGNTCLIDGGSSSEKEVGRYRIESFLKYKGVGSLDYVFLSHGDEDHINGIMQMMERELLGIRIRRLVLPTQGVWEEKMMELAHLAKEKGISLYVMEQGQQLVLDQVSVTCLWPKQNLVEMGNESSLVLSLSYKKFDALFTGDLENAGEAQLCQVIEQLQEKGKMSKKIEFLNPLQAI